MEYNVNVLGKNVDLVLVTHCVQMTVEKVDARSLAEILDIEIDHAALLIGEANDRFPYQILE